MTDRSSRIRRIAGLLLAACLSGSCGRRETTAVNKPAAQPPAGKASAARTLTTTEQHIIFTGVVAFLERADGTIRFVAPKDNGRHTTHPIPSHMVWLMAPDDPAITSATNMTGVVHGTVNLTSKVMAFPISDSQIVIDSLTGGAVTRNVAGIADARDFNTRDAKADPRYLTSPPSAASGVSSWGDLTGGQFMATHLATYRDWRYGTTAVQQNGDVCRPLAQEVCHLTTRPAGPSVIRILPLGGGAPKNTITVKPSGTGVIEVRILYISEPPIHGYKAPIDPDHHFALFHQIAADQTQTQLLPYICHKTGKPDRPGTPTPHDHGMDYDITVPTDSRDREFGASAASREATSKLATMRWSVGSINCPPTWWCSNPPNCE